MARIEVTDFSQLSEAERIEALDRYRVQNPKKWEVKKEALLKLYGLTPEAVVEPEPDAAIEAAKKVVAKKAVAKKVAAKTATNEG